MQNDIGKLPLATWAHTVGHTLTQLGHCSAGRFHASLLVVALTPQLVATGAGLIVLGTLSLQLLL
jgi:hypothetical protein